MNPVYRSAVNRDVKLASVAEFAPVKIGEISVWPPVVLAPMAGVTNYPFRSICKEFGAGLYVSEMINARPLVDGRDKTLKLADFGPDESPRSLQLYGTDPYYIAEAVKRLVSDGRVDHLDMNFGGPVPKVTRKGGGAAIPLKPNLLRNIVRAAVCNAERVPVTIKFRMGINLDHLTFLTAGRVAEDEGCAAVGLHARTAAQLYHGHAEWNAIAELKQAVKIPVLGNGDIWEAEDALRMMRQTNCDGVIVGRGCLGRPWLFRDLADVLKISVLGNGDIWEAEDALRMMRQTNCDGVIVGRGCLGRPWLFRDLADVFNGREPLDPPSLGEVLAVMFRHAQRLSDWFGERLAMHSFRRHA